MLPSVRQISDVVLVHDERVTMEPTADETMGFYPLVGAEVVVKEGAVSLGRVRCGGGGRAGCGWWGRRRRWR